MIYASADRLAQDLHVIAEDIGIRLAGTPSEQAAADYVTAQARAAGATVHQEPVTVNARVVTAEELQILVGNEWRPFPCSLFSNTPGTGGHWREAPIVCMEPTDYQRADLSHLRGAAVIHLGCHIESRASYARLLAAEPAFLLMVDTRYPGATPLADGMFPAYTQAIGAVPTLNVAYQDAWGWLEHGASRARCRVAGGMQPGQSQNVVIDLPGTDLADEILYVGGHHDTQAASPGADDNGTGTIGVIELTRLLAPLPRRRTIRLICFGAEEQLSVGSADYVRRHRAEVEAHGKLMFNLDSYGSRLGWTQAYLIGPAEFEAAFRPYFHAQDVYYQVVDGVVPYADHFPFAVAGVPGVFLHRVNCTGGRFFHHRPDDDISRVDFDLVARNLNAVGHFLQHAASCDSLSFPSTIPGPQQAPVAAYWTDLFGGW